MKVAIIPFLKIIAFFTFISSIDRKWVKSFLMKLSMLLQHQTAKVQIMNDDTYWLRLYWRWSESIVDLCCSKRGNKIWSNKSQSFYGEPKARQNIFHNLLNRPKSGQSQLIINALSKALAAAKHTKQLAVRAG